MLLATHNQAKFKELKLGIKPLEEKGVKIISLNDLAIKDEPDEIGKDFSENARLKAYYYSRLTKLPTIADDGGLLIDIFNGEPGVKSKRWLGYEASDQELIKYTLKRLADIPKDKRTAYLQTSLCYYDSLSETCLEEQEKIKGYIAFKPSGRPTEGYPYRALFIVEKYNKYYDELTDKEHNQINHRIKALKRLIKKMC